MQNSKAVILCNRSSLKDQLQPAEQYVVSISLVYFVEVCQSFAAQITKLSPREELPAQCSRSAQLVPLLNFRGQNQTCGILLQFILYV